MKLRPKFDSKVVREDYEPTPAADPRQRIASAAERERERNPGGNPRVRKNAGNAPPAPDGDASR